MTNQPVDERENRRQLRAWQQRSGARPLPVAGAPLPAIERETLTGCQCPFWMTYGVCKRDMPHTLASKPRQRRGARKTREELAAAIAVQHAEIDRCAACWLL